MDSRPILEGQFAILRRLGEGAMGRVYLAEDILRGGCRVALKVMRPEAGGAVRRLQQEFDVLARLAHPGIARVYDFGPIERPISFPLDGQEEEIAGGHFLAQEYLEGIDLLEASRALHGEAGPGLASFEELCDVAAQVGRALDYLHSQEVIHYDIKPTNVIVAREGGAPLARLVDFGVA